MERKKKEKKESLIKENHGQKTALQTFINPKCF